MRKGYAMIAFQQAVLGYPGREVIHGLTLALPEQGTVALMTPSGFGKTLVCKARLAAA